MNAQEIVSEIKKLDLGIVDSKAEMVESAIAETAEVVARSGLFLVKGSTSPSSKRSYQRLYLQKRRGVSHDSRTSDYQENILDVWEWQTRDGEYRRPISAGSLIKALAAIRSAALAIALHETNSVITEMAEFFFDFGPEKQSGGTPPNTSLNLPGDVKEWLREQGGVQPTLIKLAREAMAAPPSPVE
jgi:hypothetical protein